MVIGVLERGHLLSRHWKDNFTKASGSLIKVVQSTLASTNGNNLLPAGTSSTTEKLHGNAERDYTPNEGHIG